MTLSLYSRPKQGPTLRFSLPHLTHQVLLKFYWKDKGAAAKERGLDSKEAFRRIDGTASC